MGGNKLFLSLDGLTLLERLAAKTDSLFRSIVLCVAGGEAEQVQALMGGLVARYGIILTEDRVPDRGPLEGLRCGLSAMPTEWGFLLGIDMPGVQEAVVRQMWADTPQDADLTAVRLDGRIVSLHAFYKKTCVPHIDAAIACGKKTRKGGAKIVAFYDDVRANILDESNFAHLPGYRKSFDNYNTHAELNRGTWSPGSV